MPCAEADPASSPCYDPSGLALFELLSCDVSAEELRTFLEHGGAQELLLPPSTEKSGREALHALVRTHFPTLLSDTRAGVVFVRRPPPLKLVAVDLDGTLWPGVLLEGLGEWSQSFRDVAAQLLALHAAGVLLVSLSRNDESPVLAAWPPPHLCAVQPHHFVAHCFGWNAKSVRLERFALAVSVAHDSVLFLDDSRGEREEVAAALPRVRVLGADMPLAASVLSWEARRATAGGVSEDASTRTEKTRALLARAEAAALYAPAPSGGAEPSRGDKGRRRAAKAAGASERMPGTGGGYATTGGYPLAFILTLELKLVLRRHSACEVGGVPPALQHATRQSNGLARAAELAARTTQFNTGVSLPFQKWGEPQDALLRLFESLVGSGDGEVWSMSAADRFGDHGTVGVAALDGVARRVLLVAVSCRVLALEPAPVFAAEVLRASPCLRGGGGVRASLAVTERNGPCRTLFARLGFSREADVGDLQEWALSDLAALPETDATVYTVTQAA